MAASFTLCTIVCAVFLAAPSVSASDHVLRESESCQTCKPIPGSSNWPSLAEWTALNTSVSGRLFSPQPPGAVCHPDWPEYNNASCAFVASQWSNTSFQAAQPLSVDYNDETCLPQPGTPCSRSGYPDYVIEAKDVADVQAGVAFAGRTGVRLVIKNTGHNFPGRSSGAYALSIYTHKLKGFHLNRNDSRAIKLGGVASVKVAAGEQVRDVNAFAAANNVTLIAGSDPNVGIAGWLSAGGHGPITSRYGLGVDQVLAMEVVTADGVHRHIDAKREPDLFWALRGGGSGTFAVLISVTFKAYPVTPVATITFSAQTTKDSDTFWSMATYFFSQTPHLSESGLMGYFWVAPFNPNASSSATASIMYGILFGPELSIDQTKAIFLPVLDKMANSNWTDKVYPTNDTRFDSAFNEYWLHNTQETAGTSARLGSRLWGNATLLGDQAALNKALRTSTPVGTELIGHLVAGPGARNPPGGVAGGNNSLLPAWRDSYVHVVLPRTWTPLNDTAKTIATEALRNVYTQALVDVAPNSGAYTNEADPTTVDWQNTFHGANYPRLLKIKHRWDPKGVFWCKSCVGSEYWTPVGPYGIENGVGQSLVQLCREDSTFWLRPETLTKNLDIRQVL